MIARLSAGFFLALTLCFLLACANREDPLLTAPALFTTRIYDNGIKQFQLQVIYDAGTRDKQQNDLMKGKDIPDVTRKRMEALLVKRLDSKLQETQYCREGYLLTREFSTLALGDLLVKGECVEGASPGDRKLFPNE